MSENDLRKDEKHGLSPFFSPFFSLIAVLFLFFAFFYVIGAIKPIEFVFLITTLLTIGTLITALFFIKKNRYYKKMGIGGLIVVVLVLPVLVTIFSMTPAENNRHFIIV